MTRRMLDWSQDHKRKVLHAALMEEGANPKEVTIITSAGRPDRTLCCDGTDESL